MIKTIYFLIISLFILYACASSDCSNDNLNKDELTLDEKGINLKQFFVWINMMPGPDFKPRINITGKIEISELSEYNIEQVNLLFVNIYQNDIQFYSVEPVVRIGENPSGDNKKLLIFSTKDGMDVKNNFEIDSVVDAEFIFEFDGNTFSQFEKNVIIQKAY